jgi:hypothetical protein
VGSCYGVGKYPVRLSGCLHDCLRHSHFAMLQPSLHFTLHFYYTFTSGHLAITDCFQTPYKSVYTRQCTPTSQKCPTALSVVAPRRTPRSRRSIPTIRRNSVLGSLPYVVHPKSRALLIYYKVYFLKDMDRVEELKTIARDAGCTIVYEDE